MADEVFKETFNKWGTYESLKKDCIIVKYFLHNLDRKIRQKTIIEQFSSMHPKTVRQHLYRLVEKKIIYEDENYKGTYYMPSKINLSIHNINNFIDNMNKLIKALIGKEIYNLAISNLKKDYEKRIADLKKQIYEYQEELRRYD